MVRLCTTSASDDLNDTDTDAFEVVSCNVFLYDPCSHISPCPNSQSNNAVTLIRERVWRYGIDVHLCGHCKAMAADWEKLAADYEGDEGVIIAEVDCTEDANRGICSDNSVQGFPTIKYGDASMLEDYQGGRSYEDLKEFAAENLKLSCSPFNLDLCEGDDKIKIEKYFAMAEGDLQDTIDKVEAIIAEAEEEVESGVEKLQAQYEALMEEHEEKVKKAKDDSDFKMLKAVLSAKKSEAGNEEL